MDNLILLFGSEFIHRIHSGSFQGAETNEPTKTYAKGIGNPILTMACYSEYSISME